MTIPGIMARLEERGFSFRLVIDATEPELITPEDENLLSKLSANRDAAIEALIAPYLWREIILCPVTLIIALGAVLTAVRL